MPPDSYLRLIAAHHRGDHLSVIAEGDRVAAEIQNDPGFDTEHERWLARTALALGAAHAAYERLSAACSYLEHGLDLMARLPDATGGRSGRTGDLNLRIGRPKPPPVGLGATSAQPQGADEPQGPFAASDAALPPFGRSTPAVPAGMPLPSGPTPRVVTGKLDTSDTDWAELLLLELCIASGRYDVATERLTPLLEPIRPATTRFAATRAQASLVALRGDDESAHFLLNTATGLANRVPSHFRVALVEGDRAMVLAGQGRTREAVAIADRLLGKLVRPAVGPYQLWSNAEGAAIALTLSRVVANEGDLLTSNRLLLVGEQAAQPLGRAFFTAHVGLARAVNLAGAGDHLRAEAELVTALQSFNTYGYRPAAALTLVEQGRLAHRRGLVRSARPLYERAIAELRALGQPRELRLARELVAALDEQRPPISGSQAPPQRPFPRYPART